MNGTNFKLLKNLFKKKTTTVVTAFNNHFKSRVNEIWEPHISHKKINVHLMAQKSLSNNRLNDVPLPIHYENIVFKIQNNLTVLINTRVSISVLYFKSSKFFRGDSEKALVLKKEHNNLRWQERQFTYFGKTFLLLESTAKYSIIKFQVI